MAYDQYKGDGVHHKLSCFHKESHGNVILSMYPKRKVTDTLVELSEFQTQNNQEILD